MLAPLRLRPFRRLAAASALSGLGDHAGEIALAALVYTETSSALATACVWIAQQGLGGVLAPALVARLERREPGCTLAALNLAQASVFAALALLAFAHALPLVLVLALCAVDGLLGPTQRALARAAVVATTQRANLHRDGNAFLNLVFTTHAAAGPAIGGVLVALVGAPTALLADALSFTVAASLLGLGARLPRATTRSVPVVAQVAADARSEPGRFVAWRHLRQRPVALTLIVADALATVCLAAVLPVEVVLVCGTLSGSAAELGTVLTAWGVGMVAGGIVATKTPLATSVASGSVLLVAGYAGMGLAPDVASVAIWSAAGGIGNGLQGMALVTLVQERTGGPFQARVAALHEALLTAGSGVGFALGGLTAALAGPRITYVAAATGAALVLLGAGVLLRAAGHRRQELQGVAVSHGGLQPVENAHVLLIEVDVEEPVQPAVIGERELAPDGSLRPAARRDRYMVVTRAAFASEGRNLDGLDVLPQPGRRAAIERAGRTGDVAAIGALTMSRNGERGLAIFAPVRMGDRSSGFVVGSFSHRVLLAGIRGALASDVTLRMTVGGDRDRRWRHGQTPSAPASPTAGRTSSSPSWRRRRVACRSV